MNTFESIHHRFPFFSRLVLEGVDAHVVTSYRNGDLGDDLRVILRKKLQQPYETRLCWLYLTVLLSGGLIDGLVVKIGIAYELLLLTMYHGNCLLDHKGEHSMSDQRWMLTAILLQNEAFQIINGFEHWQVRDFLRKEFIRVSTLFHKGQYSDVSINILENIDFRWNQKEYWNKIYLINAHMYESIARTTLFMNPTTRLGCQIIMFGRYYGYLIQLINDIIDFVPASLQDGTAEKVPDDAYADIRNRHVTLPFYYFWKTLSVNSRNDFIKRFGILVDSKNEELARMMVQSGAINRAQCEARKIARKCRVLMKQFPRVFHDPLNEMLVIAYSNRFYKAFKRLR